ncbi:sodium:solute symporter [Candidatus Desulfofervidus auxilii]|uniref:Sodium:solute symporter n=1 Tax=Desulfofervidus auxilii TaxID=1621989 RepID=A0A7U4QJY0_DESA2|nr:hypothetical protein [Candidatus Desulfofervidus auxilii]AMM40738.1 sodium:solute symporter [Candidatus Desulfofervidus auxilii]CAD7774286.1 hypothetical protein BLFGPEAP_01087 [Candidatus Methanoperedenaceae archaeon GB50]CAD7775600.1 hypothetical protein DMNBHIDG_01153 [Candidatus Methanoperedenaceae archaeon GB37]
MSLPDSIALILTCVTLFRYFIIGVQRSSQIETMDDFFFYGRRLGKLGYERTFVATGLSLATVLFFFLDFGGKFGVPLVLSPLMFCLGTYIFILILPRLQKAGFLERGTTLHNFVGKSFNWSALRYSSAIVSILGYLGIFVIELYVGVEIFKIFSTSTQWTAIVAIFIMSLIFIYTYLGGYKAIIDTDSLQLKLIVTGTLLALISLVIFQFKLPKTHPPQLFPFPGWLPIPFIIVMIIGNVPFQILRMSHWQRAAAVGNMEIIKSGLKRGIFVSFIIWIVFGAMGLLLYWIANLQKPGAIILLEILRNNTLPYNIIVYPMLFTAFVAALISTADTVFMTVLNSYIYDFKLHRDLHDENQDARLQLDQQVQEKGLKSSRRAILFILFAGVILYYVLTQIFGFEFIDLLFVFFNQQLVLFPAVVLAIKAPNGSAHPARYGALCGIWIGWLAVWGVSIYGKQIDNPDLVLYASAVGWLVAIIVTIVISFRGVLIIMRRKGT